MLMGAGLDQTSVVVSNLTPNFSRADKLHFSELTKSAHFRVARAHCLRFNFVLVSVIFAPICELTSVLMQNIQR